MTISRGADSYTGEWIHCTGWDHRRDLTGRRVAVIGGGAAVARILPAVAANAERVTVFQTDPVWVLPRPPFPFPAAAQELALHLPTPALHLAARANLRLQVADSWVRRQLTPDAPTDIRWHNHYYAALQRENCKLISFPIATFVPLGLRTVDGIEHRVDCVVFAADAARITQVAA